MILEKITKAVITSIVLSSASISGAQVPPPPPSNDTVAIAAVIRDAYRNHNLERYSNVIADDISVVRDDGKKLDGKKNWLESIGPKIKNKDILFTIEEQYFSPIAFVNVESINTAATFDTGRIECCWSTDVVKYTIKGGKISNIYVMSAGGRLK